MEAAEENLKTLRDEKREFCLLDVAIAAEDVPWSGDKEEQEASRAEVKTQTQSQEGDSQGRDSPAPLSKQQ